MKFSSSKTKLTWKEPKSYWFSLCISPLGFNLVIQTPCYVRRYSFNTTNSSSHGIPIARGGYTSTSTQTKAPSTSKLQNTSDSSRSNAEALAELKRRVRERQG